MEIKSNDFMVGSNSKEVSIQFITSPSGATTVHIPSLARAKALAQTILAAVERWEQS